MNISIAVEEDIPSLVKLINSAYRGEESKKGWTTEAYVLAGEMRIDEPALLKLMLTENSWILKYENDTGMPEGCVFLQKRGDRMYLGMLTVSPTRQAKGIGKELVKVSETHAQSNGCQSVFFRVISVRQELIDWYVRRGYHLTGETEPLPDEPRFGMPLQPLEFVIMEKHLPG